MKKLLQYFTENQRTLLIIDSVGGFLTAFSLFVIVRQFSAYFGMPKHELTFLTVVAICCCIYSAACSVFIKGGLTHFIRLIARVNILYCVWIIGLLVTYYSLITKLGMVYFLMEIAIICCLSYIELTVAAKRKQPV